MGDPYFYDYGQNFSLVAASCLVKAQAFGESGAECLDSTTEDAMKYLNNIRVVYKYVTQYFNLESYMKDGIELVSNSQKTVQVDLQATQSIANKSSLQ